MRHWRYMLAWPVWLIWCGLKWIWRIPPIRYVARFLWWLVWDFPGVRLVWERLVPPKRSPSTFVVWLVGIYTALFGLASARYENAVDRVEIRAGAVVALLANDNVRNGATSQIGAVQKRLVPKRPEYGTLFFDSFWKQEPHQEAVDLLKTAVESCKKRLKGANLVEADLSGAKLWEANLEEAILVGTNLRASNLQDANLKGANLDKANLVRANLVRANLLGVDLQDANLQDANLRGANLRGASLILAYLRYAYLYNSDLRGARLQGARLQFATLQGANLQRANLGATNLRDADLLGADLESAYLHKTYLNGANLMAANFSHSILYDISLDNNACWKDIGRMQGAILVGWKAMPEDFVVFAFTKGAEILDREDYEWTQDKERSRLSKMRWEHLFNQSPH